MDQTPEIEDLEILADETDADQAESVDDFFRELEEKEKDLHITGNTSVIELAEAFEDPDDLPPFLREELAAVPAATPRPAVGAAPQPDKAISRLQAEVAALKLANSKLEGERDELLIASKRRARDFENFKARTERERKETFQNQVGNLATQLLPALDNLHRAVDFALEMPQERKTEFQQFLDGVVLVSQQVNEVLAGMGIDPIATVGETFDPHFHEAVATEETDEFPDGVIAGEILKGYRIGDRVIRHSMVKVAKSPPEATHESVNDEPTAARESDGDTGCGA